MIHCVGIRFNYVMDWCFINNILIITILGGCFTTIIVVVGGENSKLGRGRLDVSVRGRGMLL
jgi:hypothetical protein